MRLLFPASVVAPDSGLDVDAILTHCRIYLSAEKVPAAVYLLDDLPRGPAGKVLLDDVKVLVAESGTWENQINWRHSRASV